MENDSTVPAKKRPFYKKVLRALVFFFILAIVVAGSLVVLLFVYEKEVKSAILTELNKHLKSEVRVDPDNIDLTILKSFPDCSIQFNDVLMLEALPIKNKDTLLFASQLNLNFNIRDLWNKKYVIEKIKIAGAVCKIRISKKGKANYIFWEESTEQESSKTDFNLNLISIENCKLSYKDHCNSFYTDLKIKTLAFHGNFRQVNYDLGTSGDLMINELSQGKTVFLKQKDCQLDVSLDVQENNYRVQKADLKINALGIKLKGDFIYKDSLENLNVQYDAPDLDISDLLSLLPSKYLSVIKDYTSDGLMYARGDLRYKDEKHFAFNSSFGIKKANIKYEPESTTAENVNVEGSIRYTNSSSFLDLKNVYLKLKDDEIKGACRIDDFKHPRIDLAATANVKLENIQSFWPIDTLTMLKGSLVMNLHARGLVVALKEKTFSDEVLVDLEATVKDLRTQFKHDPQTYTVENCNVTARERQVEVKDLRLKRGSSDLVLNGTIPGLFNYIIDSRSPLIINGHLLSGYIKMEDFLTTSKEQTSNVESTIIPDNIQFKLDADIKKFSFGKFEAERITGDIEIKNKKAIISDVKLSTMGGDAEINAFLDNTKNKLDVVLQSYLKNIDINTLFRQMNSFGNSTLSEKNIRGIGTATIDFSGSWDNNLVVDYKSIESNSNLIIDRGELIDFKPLLILSRFVEVEELKRIKFSTLQSNVQIRDQVITIPRTTIKNSALNIDVWGTHTFNNEIDYHIQLLISELLAKKRKNKDSEFGPVANDPDNKRSAFIRMKGTLDNPKLTYDKQGMKEKIKNDIKQEKQTIRRVLKEEIGLFKKDTLLKKERSQETFELEKHEKPAPKKTLELKKKKEDEEDF